MSIGNRSISSSSWKITASGFKVAIFFIRTILLARWLPIEVFGVYALANSIVRLSGILPEFGMRGAFLHRTPETEDEGQTAATHFTLKLVFVSIWMLILISGTALLASGPIRLVLWVLTIAIGINQLTQTPRLVLKRRVVHRRLALIDLVDAVLTTTVALVLARAGETIWALLATDIVSVSLAVLGLYVWRPVWRPHFAWPAGTVKYFLRFGSRTFLADVLLQALDRLDDLFTGFVLGETALGFYSRAYKFATYPRQILAKPINNVMDGTLAELKNKRTQLSRAFFRTTAFLTRTSFLLAGLLALIAPEFIRLFLGHKWLPMLDAFRLMLIFTMLDPLKVTLSNLFIAAGRPDRVIRARIIQLGILLIGLVVLGSRLDITGVAIAVDLMLVVGMAILFWQARQLVDFSPRTLFLAPSVAMIVGMVLARAAILVPGVLGSSWRTAFVKIIVFLPVYGLLLFAMEKSATLKMARIIFKNLNRPFLPDDFQDNT